MNDSGKKNFIDIYKLEEYNGFLKKNKIQKQIKNGCASKV